MDAKLGRAVLDHVTAHRTQFDMSDWGIRDPECGTIACLGGWAMLLSGYRLEDSAEGEVYKRPDGSEVEFAYIGDEAAKLLQLTAAERYGTSEDDCSVFTEFDEDKAIARFSTLVEAAEHA